MNQTASWLGSCLFVFLLVCAVAAAPAIASSPAATAATGQSAPEGAPQAEAGLDQTVERNASVLLDATQSHSPEGEIVSYDWTITSPSGDAITQTCDSTDCGLAHFRVPELGDYTVSVTVTDDDGQTATDTLYVAVVPRGDFGVELQGSPDATGEEANLTTTISPGAAVVENVTWYRGDQRIGNQSVSELGGVINHTALIAPGATYRAVVADQWNQTVSDTWSAPGGTGSWTPSTPSSEEYPRIEGPAVITGEPDAITDDGWEYEGLDYVVRTSEHGTVTNAIWGVGNGDAENYAVDGTQAEFTLRPGVNTVTANLDLTVERLGNYAGHGMGNSTAYSRINTTVSTEAVLHRNVIVDPEPEIQGLEIDLSGNSLLIKYTLNDKHNPADSMDVVIGDSYVITGETMDPSGIIYKEVEIPDGEHDETEVTVKVDDGRQTVSRTQTVLLPPDPEEARSRVTDVMERLLKLFKKINPRESNRSRRD